MHFEPSAASTDILSHLSSLEVERDLQAAVAEATIQRVNKLTDDLMALSNKYEALAAAGATTLSGSGSGDSGVGEAERRALIPDSDDLEQQALAQVQRLVFQTACEGRLAALETVTTEQKAELQSHITRVKQTFAEVDSRFAALEARLSDVEGKLAAVEHGMGVALAEVGSCWH